MGALTVLIIDIDESLQSAVLALRDAEFRVIKALESGEGVKHTLEYSPSLIVINEDMPPINGVELVPILRSLTESPIVAREPAARWPWYRPFFRGRTFISLIQLVSTNLWLGSARCCAVILPREGLAENLYYSADKQGQRRCAGRVSLLGCLVRFSPDQIRLFPK
jgi:hypothetical protein